MRMWLDCGPNGAFEEAIDYALRAGVCGEPVRTNRKVLRQAMKLGKVKADVLDPRPLAHPRCRDKKPPKVRKVAKRDWAQTPRR